MRVAVMQPYFFPYGGYWRLLTEADQFVIFDCVQFPRRGRVHRSEISPGRWLTLPLQPAPRSALIREMQLSDDAPERMQRQLAACGWANRCDGPFRRAVYDLVSAPAGPLVDYLERGLLLVAEALGAKATILRSSTLGVPDHLRKQDRVIEIARRLGATQYLNSPGGRSLYDEGTFAEAGLALEFLPIYEGRIDTMLGAIFDQPLDAIRADVRQALPGERPIGPSGNQGVDP